MLNGVLLRITAIIGLMMITLAIPTDVSAQPTTGLPPPTNDRDDRGGRDRPQVADDVARVSRGRAEYVVSGPISDADVAADTLRDAGARLISTRELREINRSVMIFDLGRRLDLEVARRLLARVAPDHSADFNNLYEYAQGQPRLYAATMIGDPAAGSCRLRQRQQIGLIDGPIDTAHRALQQANIFTDSALIDGQRAPNAQHGTAVATLIVGNDPNGALAGFASGAQLFAVNAFAREHSGVAADVERIAASLNWLLANDVRLINMSFTGPSNTVFADLLVQAEGAGAIMIAAAGNDGRNVQALPAASPSVIAVTAVDAAMRRYRRANWGAHIEFAAPGVDIYVASADGGTYATGTSYAAPIITALAARSGASSVGALRTRLRNQALDLGNPGRDTEFGWGLVRNIGC